MTALTDPVLGLEVPDQVTYFKEMLRVNVTTGKMLRGNAVLQSLLCIRREPETQLLLTAHAVGWAFEVMQAALLMADDIMDGSVTRRGKPCWYKLPEIGMMAVNDVISLQTAVYELLTRFAKWHPEYQTLVDLLTACFRLTVMGQSLDAMTSPREGRRPDLALMTEARYATIAKYKTSYYTFSHPIRAGLYLARVTEERVHREAEEILIQIGTFFQQQDDFLDCFGDPEVTGKIGRDIEDGKLCWPLLTALSSADATQVALLQRDYGCEDAAAVARVKQLYADLGVREAYAGFEEREFLRLSGLIDAFAERHPHIPRRIFSHYLDLLFKRNK